MEHPLIAKPHEVQAMLAGRQTQLRRTVKPGPGMQAGWLKPEILNLSPSAEIGVTHANRFGAQFEHPGGGPLTFIYCPYGQPGDRLWVREKWFPMRYDWRDWDSQAPFQYADGSVSNHHYWGIDYCETKPPVGHSWKSAACMPRAASRLLLEIVAVRVERLQDITRSDIRAEGLVCPPELASDEVSPNYRDWYPAAWQDLWASINGPDSWAANPWVWVVEFRVVTSAPSPTTSAPAAPAGTGKEGGRG